MITLTVPVEVNSVLGGNAPIGYDKVVVAPLTLDANQLTVSGEIRIISTSTPTMQPIVGRMRINAVAANLDVEIPLLDFYRRISLNQDANNYVIGKIKESQAAFELGLIAVGVVSGVRSDGV